MNTQLIIVTGLAALTTIISSLHYRSQALKRSYKKEVLTGLKEFQANSKVITESDLEPLPVPVQKYLRYVGAVGRERVQNFRAVFEGAMKAEQGQGWMQIAAEQYSFMSPTIRQFYISGKMFGLPVIGLHSYTPQQASMLIKVAGLITVAEVSGREMELGETVTVFNNMCIMAPAALVDERISWETIDSLTVKATFRNNDRKIAATLYFNETGQLTNFVSEDRYMTKGNSLIKLRWSTPVRDYRDFGGIKLPSYGEAVWHTPEGDYTYAKSNFKSISYNLKNMQ